MSLNQPSPPKEPSLLEIAKQTVAVATTKVTAAKEVIEDKAHDVLPSTIANLALGERKVHQDDGPSPTPTYPRYKPPTPESLGIVEPDIRTATPSDDDDDDDEDSSISSWEAILHHLAPQTRKARRGERKRLKATGHYNKKENGVMVDLGSQFKSTCPPQVAEAMAEREEWKESLRKVREQRGKGKGVVAARRARPVTVEDGRSSSEESYESKSSDEFVRELERHPYSRSWRHGVGKKVVTVPCGSLEEVERTYHRVNKSEAVDPKEFLEKLGVSQYKPVGTGELSSVGSDLSRYRDMGKYFKPGSVGDSSRDGNP